MPPRKSRRLVRNYFPEPQFQFRFLRFLVVGSVLQIIATCAILFYFLRQNYLLLVKYAGLEPPITEMLFGELRFLVITIAITFSLFLLGTTLLGIAFSHRIGGAVFAIKRTIRAIIDGKDEQLHLREGDEFRDLVDSFNLMVKVLKEGR